MNVFFLFSLFDDDDPAAAYAKLTPQAKERLLIFGAIFLVIIGVLLWAVLFRKSRRRAARRESHRHRRTSFAKRTAKGVAELKQYVQERQRRSRRRHRPRNPTLAETGGLPPPRTELPSGDPP